MQDFKKINFILLGILVLILIGLYFIDPIYSADTATINYVLKRWFATNLSLWNPTLFGGIYAGASTVSGYYTPEMLLYFIFDDYTAQHLSMILVFGLGVFGSYRFMELKTKSIASSLFFTLTYMLAGHTLSMTINYVFFAGICLLPFALYQYENHKLKRTGCSTLFFGLSTAWVLLVGDIYAFLTLVLYVLTHLPKEKDEIIDTIYILTAGLIISFVNYIPGLDVLSSSSRADGVSLNEASFFSLHPKSLWQLIHPSHYGFFGDGSFKATYLIPKDFPFPKRFWSDSIYFGFLPLLVLITGLFKLDNLKRYKFNYSLVLLFLLISFGGYFFIHKILFYLPIYKNLRFPAKFFTIVSFFAIYQASLNFDFFVKDIQMKIELDTKSFAILTSLILFVLAIDLGFNSPPLLKAPKETIEIIEKQKGMEEILKAIPTRPFKVLWDDNITLHSKAIARFHPNWGILHGAHYTFGAEPTITKEMIGLTGNEVFKNFDKWSDKLGINYILTTMSPREQNLKRFHDEGFIKPIALNKEANIALLKRMSPIDYKYKSSHDELPNSFILGLVFSLLGLIGLGIKALRSRS